MDKYRVYDGTDENGIVGTAAPELLVQEGRCWRMAYENAVGQGGHCVEPVKLRRRVRVSSHNHHSSMSAASQLTFLMSTWPRRNEGASMFNMASVLKTVSAGLVTVGLLTLGALGGTSAASATARSSATVPVTVLGGQGSSQGARPTVEVRVGNSNPVPVLLDTGSSGLRIFNTAVNTGTGSGVTLTSQPSNITYSGGHRFTGVVANAVVTIGSSATQVPVSFAYVEQAFCIASKPTCPASGGIPGFEQSGAYGILGIGTQSSGGGIVSPILGMPGSLAKKWSLHLAGASGTLTLGATLIGAGSAATIPMRQIGSSAGSALWADSRLPLCLSVGQTNACVPGLFDSGTYTMQVSGSVLGQAPTIAGTDHVVVGTPVTVSLNGASAPFWTFNAGTTKSADLVTVRTRRGPFVNTGVQAFYDYTITYDDTSGQILLSR